MSGTDLSIERRLRALMGPDAIIERDGGGMPTVAPRTTEACALVLATANSEGWRVRITGGGSWNRVEGHADASGPETYNLTLSERRAHAVRKYLIEQHGVDSTKVLSIGRGESELYDPKDPSAGINRRVEFTNLRG